MGGDSEQGLEDAEGYHECNSNHYWTRNGDSPGMSGPKMGSVEPGPILVRAQLSSSPHFPDNPALFCQLKQVVVFLEAKAPYMKAVKSYNSVKTAHW